VRESSDKGQFSKWDGVDYIMPGYGDASQPPFENDKTMNALRRSICSILILSFLLASMGLPAVHAQSAGEQVWLPLVLHKRLPPNPVHQGIATYYNATGDGACMFGPSPNDLMVAAMNAEEYDNAAVCGSYVFVSGPKGTITVRIVDLCPECKAGHLDLSREAFAAIADLPLGVVPITWQVVSPELDEPIAYHFKDGSNPWWTAVQIRNHRNPIAKLEYLDGTSQWVSVPRTSYNYFVQTNPGMGAGPYTFRVTDSYGNLLIDSGIPHVENGTISGSAQFPPGP
jgi:expansin (peptidoglycan-binding protein)